MPFGQRTLFCVPRHKMSLLVMEPPTKEVLEKVRGEFGLNEQRVKDAVEHLKEWIRLQPHLPKEIGTFCLRHCKQHQIVHNRRRVTGRCLTLLACYTTYVACYLPSFRSSLLITQNMVLKIRE